MVSSSSSSTELVRKANVQELVVKRDACLKRYETVYALRAQALAELKTNIDAMAEVNPGNPRFFPHTIGMPREATHLYAGHELPGKEEYMTGARRLVDNEFWHYVAESTGLFLLMDVEAKCEFVAQLRTDPPEFTFDTVRATLESFLGQADTVFRRGVANCFVKLDKRFKSHDGWKLGSRVILPYAITEYNCWSSYNQERGMIMDVERVFKVLDGKEMKNSDLTSKIEARCHGFKRKTFVVETEYFKARVFQNGNIHLYFLRNDLMDKVNRLIGEHFKNSIPAER